DNGEYGFCEECGDEIGIARLRARPVTTLCISCKEAQEKDERQKAKSRGKSDRIPGLLTTATPGGASSRRRAETCPLNRSPSISGPATPWGSAASRRQKLASKTPPAPPPPVQSVAAPTPPSRSPGGGPLCPPPAAP